MFKQLILLSVLSMSVAGCLDSPERSNPLDPKSENFDDSGVVTGRVLSYYAPFTPISNAEISFEPGSFVTLSNTQGEFTLPGIPADTYTVRATKEGYADTNASIEVTLGQPTMMQLNLNGLPIFKSISVTSGHISRTFPASDLFFLQAETETDDPDGFNDIQLVEIEIPRFGFADTLNVTQTPGVFSGRVLESEINTSGLPNVLGYPIFLIAHDRPGSSRRSDAQFMARIIERTPQTESPDERELLTDPNPTLVWRAVDLPYKFTYRVEVLSVDFGAVTPVWSLSGIDSAQTSVEVAEPLISGDYNWAVAIVDEFGNWSRSQEASFRIN